MEPVHGELAEARVRWDSRARRPREVAWGDRVVRVAGLTSIRDERAAYPAGRGPRVTYLLQTDAGGSAVLVFDGARRRWYVQTLGTDAA
jgi:hypothetical protein